MLAHLTPLQHGTVTHVVITVTPISVGCGGNTSSEVTGPVVALAAGGVGTWSIVTGLE